MVKGADFELARKAADAPSIMDNSYFGSVKLAEQVTATEQPPEMDVPVNTLVPGFYLRQAGTSAAHVKLLADAAGSTRLPPILVQKHSMRIIDGMHRFEAAKLRMKKHISVCFIDCTDEEAFILAVKSNTLHGLPLSRAERLSGAKRILMSHPDWSDRAVAEVTGLSAKTVGVLRNRSAGAIPLHNKRLGRDGKLHPVSGVEGRKRAAEYINTHPDALVRQIAKEVGVSLGTAHDVRERIRRGADPMAERFRSRSEQGVSRSKTDASLNSSPSGKSADIHTARRNVHSRSNIQQLTWSAVSAKLANDPALRYTEGGRAFLRWMALHAANTEEWGEFVDAIPVHWLGDISLVASEVSEEWRRFAERLRSKRASAS